MIKQALRGNVFKLATDAQGTHVIQKVFECDTFKRENSDFVFDEIRDHFIEVCKDKHGLVVVKKLVSSVKRVDLQK